MNKRSKAAMYTSAVLALGLVLATSPVLGYAQQEVAGQAGAGETSVQAGNSAREPGLVAVTNTDPVTESNTAPDASTGQPAPGQDSEQGQASEYGTVAEPGSSSEGSEAGQEGTEPGDEGTDAGGEPGSGTEGPEAGEDEEDVESEEALEEDEAARALAEAEALAGDVNADGRLSVADLAIAAASLGADEEHADWPALQVADLDDSGSIDRQDLTLLAEAILAAEE
ncbi:dockerin type I repeat-containing protein [Paenibacillus sp. 598K]|uniref:dockerin type I repeat-containing protein n=1 Tax=Paenibacillus sp. 598K TaxID=1117987 RepID=UPI000FFF47A2|nr:dockerin type I repeat-containing protein [Paenibacillus sp. 598K]